MRHPLQHCWHWVKQRTAWWAASAAAICCCGCNPFCFGAQSSRSRTSRLQQLLLAAWAMHVPVLIHSLRRGPVSEMLLVVMGGTAHWYHWQQQQQSLWSLQLQ